MEEPRSHEEGRADLEATLQTALDVGLRVQVAGGYTERTSAAMRDIAHALGADSVEPAVTFSSVGLTVYRDGWSRTAFREAPPPRINFTELTELTQLARHAEGKSLAEIRAGIDDIAGRAKRYPSWLVLPMLGVSCGAFAGIFHADLAGVLIATLAGFAGALCRHKLAGMGFKAFLFCLVSAFVSTAIVIGLDGLTEHPDAVLAACVLYLIPGVPLLNGTSDLLAGYYLNGVVRLTLVTMIVAGSAVGMVTALAVFGL